MTHTSCFLRCVRNGDTVGIKHLRAAVRAGGKIIQMVETVIRLLARHRGILHLQAAHMPHDGMYAPPADLLGSLALSWPRDLDTRENTAYTPWITYLGQSKPSRL